jgi:hypothetical protein
MRSRIAAFSLCLLGALASGGGAARIAEAGDGREAVSLAHADREYLLAGMRRYLDSVQGIVDGLARSNMAAVAESARKAGAAMVSDISLVAIVGLPPDFLLASMATHQKFDELADEAKTGATRMAVLDKLSGILATCNACHETYRVAIR